MASPTNSAAIAAALAKPNYVPAGITQAYLEQNRDQPAVIAILFIASFVTVILALRCYARLFYLKKFGQDDWLALLTMLPYISFVILSIVLIHLGSGRHIEYIEYVLDNQTTNLTEVLDFAAHILYISALLICRLSGLAFYRRICDRHHKFIIAIRCTAAFLLLAYLPQLLLLIFHCQPVTGYWPYAWQAESNSYTCLEWGTVYVTNGGISLVADLLLFTIPATLITVLQASTWRKIKLSFVLFPGILVIAISCARLDLVVEGQWETDQSWYYDPFLAIENAEIGATLFALSVPSIKPLFGDLLSGFDNVFSKSLGSSCRNSHSHSSRSYRDDAKAIGNPQARPHNDGSWTASRGGIAGDDVEFSSMPQTRRPATSKDEERAPSTWETCSPESSHNNDYVSYWDAKGKDHLETKAGVVVSGRRRSDSTQHILPK